MEEAVAVVGLRVQVLHYPQYVQVALALHLPQLLALVLVGLVGLERRLDDVVAVLAVALARLAAVVKGRWNSPHYKWAQSEGARR